MSSEYSYEEHAKEMPTIRVEFFLIAREYEADLNLETITQALGMAPTKARKKTDYPPGPQKAKVARDVWYISTPKEKKYYSITGPFEEVVAKLEGKSDIIKYLAETFEMNFGFVVYIHTNKPEGNPQMLFSRRAIEFMASIGADAGIDYYRY